MLKVSPHNTGPKGLVCSKLHQKYYKLHVARSWTLREVIYPPIKIILLKPTRSYTYSKNTLKCIFKKNYQCCKLDSSKKKENLSPIPPKNNFKSDRTSSFNSRIQLCLGIKAELFHIKIQTSTSKLNKTHTSAQAQLFNFLYVYKKNWSKPLKILSKDLPQMMAVSCHHIFVNDLK